MSEGHGYPHVHIISISELHLNVGAYFTTLNVYMQVLNVANLEFCFFNFFCAVYSQVGPSIPSTCVFILIIVVE